MKKAILKSIYNLGGFAPFRWANRGNVLILTYHRFSPKEHPFRISAEKFEKHLEYLKRNNHVISLNEVAEAVKTGEKLPQNSVAITIDDGYRDAYEIAFPLLKKFNFAATLFAITDFVEGKIWLWTDKMRYVLQNTKAEKICIEFAIYDTMEKDMPADDPGKLKLADRINSILKKLPDEEKEAKILEIAESLDVKIPETPVADYAALNWKMVREMDANNLNIESHTATHPMLTNIGADRLDLELRASKESLEDHLGRKVETFCYPSGAFNETVRQAVKHSGYKCAVTTRYGFVGQPESEFLLSRIDAQPELVDFAQSVSGFEAFKQNMRGG